MCIRDSTSDYHNYFRMSAETFQLLVKMVEPYLVRKSTAMRGCISVEERLALTLRYLATGRHFEDLKFSVIMSTSTISNCHLRDMRSAGDCSTGVFKGWFIVTGKKIVVTF